MAFENIVPIKPVAPLRPSAFQLQQFAYRQHSAVIPVGVSIESVLDPKNAYFSLVGRNIQYGDEIRALAEDGSYVAVLFVTFADGSNIHTHVVSHTELTPVSEEVVTDYKIILAGPKKYCIRRESDGQIVKEGIANKLAAERELADYVKALSR
jgi:hypothetical protein